MVRAGLSKKFINIFIDIYETNPIRGSSYIPTPPKFNNSRCGLINIQNDDQECFRWCLKYHQSAKDKNASRICKLKNVVDKYNYEGIEYPTSYDDIYNFEEINKVCVYVYTLAENNSIIIDTEGTAEYAMNEIIHLLRIEEEDNSHYVYIKKIENFINLSTHSCDKGKRYCPNCNKKIKEADFTKHVSKCLKFHKDGTFIKLPECVGKCKLCMSFKSH